MLKLEGVVEHVIYENPDTGYAVFEVDAGGTDIVVAGNVGSVDNGMSITAYGYMVNHPSYGEQFKAETIEASLPEDTSAILSYLSSGVLPYIGPSTAKKLVAKFGEDTLNVIAQTPQKLCELKGINEQKAAIISNEFRRMYGVREVVAWFARYGLTAQQAVTAYRAFGPHTVEALPQNPYLLCGEPLQLKFGQVDGIAVAVNDATIHFDKLYSYLVPPDFSESLWPGSIVLVPFGRGNHPRMAVVLEVGTEEAPDPRLKSLLAAAPEKARLTPDLLELVHFLKDRYFCTWYEAVKAVIPYGAQYQPGMENGKPVLKSRLTRTLETVYTLVGGLPEKPKPGARQIQAVEALRAGPCTKSALEAQGISSSTLNGLCQKGILKAEQRDKSLDLFADIPFDPQPSKWCATGEPCCAVQ